MSIIFKVDDDSVLGSVRDLSKKLAAYTVAYSD
jgi:hypothetical protein